ncbi:MAG: hypothetical protein HOP36_10320 [Methyloglobulus sp.]|nr:hypothetical protein [Methyloglobulus sp.]
MSTITLTTDSLRALINVYKTSLEIQQTLQLSAIDVSDEGKEIWDESLDWPDLGICYFDLSKAIDQAKSEAIRLEAIVNSSEASSFSLKLSAQIEGQESDDLQDALKEVLRLVEDDFTTGFDHNETGSYRFSID